MNTQRRRSRAVAYFALVVLLVLGLGFLHSYWMWTTLYAVRAEAAAMRNAVIQSNKAAEAAQAEHDAAILKYGESLQQALRDIERMCSDDDGRDFDSESGVDRELP